MTIMKKLSIATIVGTAFMALGVASGGQRVEAASFSFTKVVDTNTNIPGAKGNFSRSPTNLPVFLVPALDNGTVAFLGYGASDSQQGIYIKTGDSLNALADRNTLIPSGTGNFAFFNQPSLDNGNVAFRGFGVTVSPEGGIRYTQSGIYTNLDGTLSRVADRNTPIPGSTGNFDSFDLPTLNNGSVAFISGSQGQGIYTNLGGVLSAVADRNTPIPDGTGNFKSFEGSVIDNESIAFLGSGGSQQFFQQGIYIKAGDSLNALADYNTPIPGGSGNFDAFNAPSLNNGSVVFKGFGLPLPGQGRSQSGIYTNLNGSFSVVADRNTPIPSGVGNFSDFGIGTPAINNGNVAFVGYGASLNGALKGIYTTLGGTLTKVIDNNDSLDGKTLSSSNFSSATLGLEGLSGNQIAFQAEFTDSSSGIYIATLNPTSIPESPMVLGVLCVGAIGVGSALKRRQQTCSSLLLRSNSIIHPPTVRVLFKGSTRLGASARIH